MRFPEWIKGQPRGTKKRLERELEVAYSTICDLASGGTVKTYALAERISKATGEAVSIEELCRPAPKRRGRA